MSLAPTSSMVLSKARSSTYRSTARSSDELEFVLRPVPAPPHPAVQARPEGLPTCSEAEAPYCTGLRLLAKVNEHAVLGPYCRRRRHSCAIAASGRRLLDHNVGRREVAVHCWAVAISWAVSATFESIGAKQRKKKSGRAG